MTQLLDNSKIVEVAIEETYPNEIPMVCDTEDKIGQLEKLIASIHKRSKLDSRFRTLTIPVSWPVVSRLFQHYVKPKPNTFGIYRPLIQTTNRWSREYEYEYFIKYTIGGIDISGVFGCPIDKLYNKQIFAYDGQHRFLCIRKYIFGNEHLFTDDFEKSFKKVLTDLGLKPGSNNITLEIDDLISVLKDQNVLTFSWSFLSEYPDRFPTLLSLYDENSRVNLGICFKNLKSLADTIEAQNNPKYQWTKDHTLHNSLSCGHPDFANLVFCGGDLNTEWINQQIKSKLKNVVGQEGNQIEFAKDFVRKPGEPDTGVIETFFTALVVSKIDSTGKINLSESSLTKDNIRKLTLTSYAESSRNSIYNEYSNKLDQFEIYYKDNEKEQSSDVNRLISRIKQVLIWIDTQVSKKQIFKEINNVIREAKKTIPELKNAKSGVTDKWYKYYPAKKNLTQSSMAHVAIITIIVSELLSFLDWAETNKSKKSVDALCELFFSEYTKCFKGRMTWEKIAKYLDSGESHESRFPFIESICEETLINLKKQKV